MRFYFILFYSLFACRQDLERFKPGTTARLVEWLKMYKTSDGKPPNSLAKVHAQNIPCINGDRCLLRLHFSEARFRAIFFFFSRRE